MLDRGFWPLALAVVLGLGAACGEAAAQQNGAPRMKWVTAWAGSAHGPYPSGNPSAQPDLSFVFPQPEARDQSFRLIVKPDLWGPKARLRFSNAFGTQPLIIDGVHAGLQASAGAIVKGTNRRVTFGGQPRVTIAPGATAWSDAVELPWVKNPASAELVGRRLAVSYHAPGPTGPMTWHAKALATSYATAPGGGAHSAEEAEDAFPFTVASWFFLDAVDVMAPEGTLVVCAFGDSITDGTNSTMNGEDRWPDFLSRRLHALHGTRVAVINAGIGGNRVVGPETYTPQNPIPGGPSALSRLERDVLSLSGVTTVIWLEGINDFGAGGSSAEQVAAGMQEGVKRMRAKGVSRIVGATLTSALGATNGTHGTPEVDQKRQALNQWIRTGGAFDAVADFDAVTIDKATGSIRPEFVPNVTVGGAGDLLHPNRMGYQAMASVIDPKTLFPAEKARR